MSKSVQLTISYQAPWRYSRSLFFSLDTNERFIDVLCTLCFVFRLTLLSVHNVQPTIKYKAQSTKYKVRTSSRSQQSRAPTSFISDVLHVAGCTVWLGIGDEESVGSLFY
jgi:hypothetical protein